MLRVLGEINLQNLRILHEENPHILPEYIKPITVIAFNGMLKSQVPTLIKVATYRHLTESYLSQRKGVCPSIGYKHAWLGDDLMALPCLNVEMVERIVITVDL